MGCFINNYSWSVVLFLIVISPVDITSQDCNLLDDSGNVIKWSKYLTNYLGEFPKTVEEGTELNGIQLQNDVKFAKKQQPNECDKFLDVASNDTHVTITTKSFSNWDQDGTSTGTCLLTLAFENCKNEPDSTLPLSFTFNVTDVNMKAPEFNQPSYTFSTPFPLPPELCLTCAFGVQIQSKDEDFSTKKIQYQLSGEDSADFQIEPLPSSGKTFPINLLTKNVLNKQKTIRFSVTATDDGIPSQSTTAEITIEPKLENSIPPTPAFIKHPNTITIDPSGLQLGDQVIEVELQEAFDNVEITVSPDTLFEAVFDGKIVNINLKQIPDSDTAFIVVEIDAVINNGFYSASSTAIVVLGFSSEASTSTTDTESPTDSVPTDTSPTSSGTTDSSPTSSGTTDSSPTSSGSTDSSPTSSGSTDSSSTTSESTDSSSTSSDSTDPSSTSSDSTDPSSTSSDSTDSLPTSSSGPTHPTPPTSDDPEESNDGLIAATVVLGISTGVSLALNGYGVYKYIYMPRKVKKLNTV